MKTWYKFEFSALDIQEGEFNVGIHSCRGEDEVGEFYAIVIGFVLFEIWISKYNIDE